MQGWLIQTYIDNINQGLINMTNSCEYITLRVDNNALLRKWSE